MSHIAQLIVIFQVNILPKTMSVYYLCCCMWHTSASATDLREEEINSVIFVGSVVILQTLLINAHWHDLLAEKFFPMVLRSTRCSQRGF